MDVTRRKPENVCMRKEWACALPVIFTALLDLLEPFI
jgi:hypothetical protein